MMNVERNTRFRRRTNILTALSLLTAFGVILSCLSCTNASPKAGDYDFLLDGTVAYSDREVQIQNNGPFPWEHVRYILHESDNLTSGWEYTQDYQGLYYWVTIDFFDFKNTEGRVFLYRFYDQVNFTILAEDSSGRTGVKSIQLTLPVGKPW